MTFLVLLDDSLLEHSDYILNMISNEVFIQHNIAQKESEIINAVVGARIALTDWVVLDPIRGDKIKYFKNVNKLLAVLNDQGF